MKSLFSILHVSEEALVLSLFALNGYTWIQEYKEFGTGEVPSKNERETEDADGGEPKKKRGRKMGYFKNYLGTNNGIRVYTDFMKCTFDLRRRVLLIQATTRFGFLRLVGITLLWTKLMIR